jgi:hypothetical protein
MSRMSQEYYRIHENDTDEQDTDPGYQAWAENQQEQDQQQQDEENRYAKQNPTKS